MFGRTSITSTESTSKEKKSEAKKRSRSMDNNDRDFENKISKSLPTWNAVWNFLLQKNNNNDNEKCKNNNKVSGRTISRSSRSFSDKDDNESLQIKIQSKIAELVKEEETLIKLYKKAADVAREREEELKAKTTFLMGQIEKDKHLMKIIRNTC